MARTQRWTTSTIHKSAYAVISTIPHHHYLKRTFSQLRSTVISTLADDAGADDRDRVTTNVTTRRPHDNFSMMARLRPGSIRTGHPDGLAVTSWQALTKFHLCLIILVYGSTFLVQCRISSSHLKLPVACIPQSRTLSSSTDSLKRLALPAV